MKISVSNIAWEREQHAEALEVLRNIGVEGVEVALTKIAPWDALTKSQLEDERRRFSDAGLRVSSYQALYYGKPELQLLADKKTFELMLEHTVHVARYAEVLSDGGVGVFGAPKNRIRGAVFAQDAFDIGCERFRALANAIHPYGFTLALEPAPHEYGGDFLEDLTECLNMVECVGHPAFGLHFDTGCLEIRPTSIAEQIKRYLRNIAHVHLSRPFLLPFDKEVDPAAQTLLTALNLGNYEGWFAIEMRTSDENLAAIAKAVEIAQRTLRSL